MHPHQLIGLKSLILEKGSVCWVLCTVCQCREKIRQGACIRKHEDNCDAISAGPTGISLGYRWVCERAEPQLLGFGPATLVPGRERGETGRAQKVICLAG